MRLRGRGSTLPPRAALEVVALTLSAMLVVLVGTPAASAAPAGSSPGVTAHPRAEPGGGPGQGPVTLRDLSGARAQAAALRSRLDRLSARQDRAEERLGYVRDRLAAASVRAVSSEQLLQELHATAHSTSDESVNRIRALYMSGGAPALYSSMLTGDDISDVISRMGTVQQVLATDELNLDAARSAVATTTAQHRRLAGQAQHRAELAGRAAALLHQVERLQTSQRQAVRHATATVQRLATALERQRAAAARAAAAASLAAYGLLNGPRPAAGNPYGDAAVNAALGKLGSPYVWGAEGPDTFDCSGLVQWSYAQAGLSLPRLADDQYFAGTPVPMSDLKPGDLLVYAYNTSDPRTIHHVTMYIGNGQMVEAPHTGAVVRVTPVYLDGLYGASRPGL